MVDHLRPDRHPQKDFFVADVLDAAPKDDLGSMEHPLFALRAGDMRPLHYEYNGNTVDVLPGPKGRATQHDKDVLIYCVSQLVEARNRGREDCGRKVRLIAYDLLVSTNRRIDGDAYIRLQEALDRLRGTNISTNIKTGGRRERSGFGLIDSYRIIEYDDKERMACIEVELSEWLYRAVETNQVLSISRDYFRLRKPLDRRLYEVVRKHCGRAPSWSITIPNLHQKAGTSDTVRKFRMKVQSLAAADELPDYALTYDHDRDVLVAYRRD